MPSCKGADVDVSLGVSLLTYSVLETTPGYGKPRFRILLPAVLLLLVTFITIGYVSE